MQAATCYRRIRFTMKKMNLELLESMFRKFFNCLR